jgi:hypothetical protein
LKLLIFLLTPRRLRLSRLERTWPEAISRKRLSNQKRRRSGGHRVITCGESAQPGRSMRQEPAEANQPGSRLSCALRESPAFRRRRMSMKNDPFRFRVAAWRVSSRDCPPVIEAKKIPSRYGSGCKSHRCDGSGRVKHCQRGTLKQWA